MDETLRQILQALIDSEARNAQLREEANRLQREIEQLKKPGPEPPAKP